MFLSVTRCAVAALLLAAGMVQAASERPWQDTPATLSLEPVGDTLRLNGTPMQIRAFRSTQSMEQLLKEVQESWQRTNRSDVTRSVVSSWTVLNQTVGEQHRSFQVRPAGASKVEGFVALTSPKLTRTPKLAVRLPADMTAVSIIDSVDQGVTSQQVIAVSRRSMDGTVSALESQLRVGGWERQLLKKSREAVVFAANKGTQQFDATVSAEKNGALIMINVLTK